VVGSDFYYIKGNGADAYHSTGFHAPNDSAVPGHTLDEAKLSDFTREIAVFPTGRMPFLVVFDHITSLNAAWPKKWLLHFIAEPQVQGTLTRVEVPTPITNYRGNLVTVDVNGQTLSSQTLLPASAIIRKVGGPGYEFWVDDPGRNYPLEEGIARTDVEAGSWRVEVTPALPALEDRFLHVLTVTDSDTTSASSAILVDGDTMVGAVAQDHVTLFSRTGAFVENVAYTVTGTTGALTHLLTGVTPGVYSVTQNGTPLASSPFIASDQHVLSFASSGGGSFAVLPAQSPKSAH
jgi:heparin/heparan-sulfate lyase